MPQAVALFTLGLQFSTLPLHTIFAPPGALPPLPPPPRVSQTASIPSLPLMVCAHTLHTPVHTGSSIHAYTNTTPHTVLSVQADLLSMLDATRGPIVTRALRSWESPGSAVSLELQGSWSGGLEAPLLAMLAVHQVRGIWQNRRG